MAVWGQGVWLNSGGRGDLAVKRGGYMAERLRERGRWLYGEVERLLNWVGGYCEFG